MPTKPKRKAKPAHHRLRLVLITAIAAVIAALGLFQFFLRTTPPAPADTTPTFTVASPLEVHRLTDLPADETEPTWSPDGARIAFVGHADGNPNVYTVDVETGDVAQITTASNDDHDPRWTSATSLAYQQRPDNRHFTYDLPTATHTVIPSPPGIWPWHWDWPAHNGPWTFVRQYVYDSGYDTAALYNLTTHETVPIFEQNPQSGEGSLMGMPVWSPDDAYVAFVYQERPWTTDAADHLYTYHRLSGTLTQVDTWGGRYQNIDHLLWLDGDTLLYNRDTHGTNPAHAVYRHDRSTGAQTLFTSGDSTLTRLLLSPSRRTLYSETARYRCDDVERHCRHLTFTDLETGAVQTRTLYHSIQGASFAPDADPDLLVFRTYGGLYRMDPKTGTWDNFFYGRHVYATAWSPGGRYLLLEAAPPPNGDGIREFMVFDTDTLALWTTETFYPWLGAVTWSPDERQFAFSSGRWGEYDLYVATLP